MKKQIIFILIIILPFHSNGQTFFKTYSAGNNENGKIFFEVDSGFILLNSVSLGLHNSELLRVGPNGDSLWQKYYPSGIFHSGGGPFSKGLNNNFITGKSVIDTNMNDSIIVYNIDTSGNISFRFSLHDTLPIALVDIIQTRDSGFLICGSCQDRYSIFDSYTYLLKTNSTGNIIWKKRISQSSYGCPETMYNLTETSDNHYLLNIYNSLCSMSGPGFYDVVRIDQGGNPVSGYSEFAYPIITSGSSLIEKNGDYIYLALLDSNNTNYTKCRKMNTAGTVVWEKSLSYYSPKYYLIAKSITNGFYLSGSVPANPDQAIITRFNDDGDSLYSYFYTGTGDLQPNYIEQLPDGRLAMVGGQLDPVSVGTPRQVFFLIADSLGNILSSTVPIKTVSQEFNVFPNPFSGDVYFSHFSGDMTLSVLDIQGRIVFTSSPSAPHLFLPELKSGTYFFRIREGGRVYWRKMMRQ